MLNRAQVLVMIADNMQMRDTPEAIIAISHAHQQIDLRETVIAYIATISLVTITSGTVITNLNTHIRNVAATFHNIIKSNAAVMYRNIIVSNAAVKFHNITTHVSVSIVQSIPVKNAVNMFHNITTSIHSVNHRVLHNNVHHNVLLSAHHNVVMLATEAKQSFNCVSYCQAVEVFLPA